MNRTMKWVLSNTVFAVLLWYALMEGSAGAGNVIVVWASLMFIGGIAALTDDGAKEIRARPRAVPAWWDQALDLLFIGVLLWNGWWWSGIAMLFAAIAVQTARSKTEAA